MEKLVRDNIIDIKIQSGETPLWRHIESIEEKIRFLLEKDREETLEYEIAIAFSDRIEEAADRLEVCDTIIDDATVAWYQTLASTYRKEKSDFLVHVKNSGIPLDLVYAKQKDKNLIKWGFKKGIILTFEKSEK